MTSLKTFLLTEQLQDSFSQAAERYDQLCGFHQKYAVRLLEGMTSNEVDILDVGCGTGHLLGMMKQKYPHMRLTGLDFSKGMIEYAKAHHQGINFVLADASQMPFKDASFDVVMSNFAFQWVGDLAQAFTETKRVMKQKGQLKATIFGYQTCEELFSSLDDAGFDMSDINRFVTVAQVQQELERAGLSSIEVQQEVVQVGFKDLLSLLSWLKAIGANQLKQKAFLGPKRLQRANAIASKNYPLGQGIGITFEVIKIQAG